jgi:flavin reductase (DIM6/NTAB) family NADH-FMN oxidoreductase RutF
MIREAGSFSVNFLASGQLDLARVGFGNPGDRFAEIEWKSCPETGAPVVTDAIGYLGCRLVRWVEGGDHDLAIAEAVVAERFRAGELLTIQDTPWTYS